jgi:tripartite ATP-independent transporter DctP family solute receptor
VLTSRRSAFRSAAAFGAAWALPQSAPFAQAARELRVADTQSAAYPTIGALQHFGDLVEHRTSGRYLIKIFHSRQLGEERETFEQTRLGAVDLSRINVGLLSDLVPEAGLLALPFLFGTTEHLHRVLDSSIGEEILNSFQRYGLVGLTFYDGGARSIYNNVRVVRAPADLGKLRIRVQQSRQMADMMRLLGAEPVPMPYGQVLTAIDTGLIDGAENNLPSYVSSGHHRVAPYLALTAHTMSPEVFVIAKKVWDGLGATEQRIFRDSARDSGVSMREQWRSVEDRARLDAESAGTAFETEVDHDAFRLALRPVHERFSGDRALRSLIERIESLR